jgi:hypothetical protein
MEQELDPMLDFVKNLANQSLKVSGFLKVP